MEPDHGSLDGANVPDGYALVPAAGVPFGPPVASGNAKQDTAAAKLHRALRFLTATDTIAGHAAYEATTPALGTYARECAEADWITGDATKPEGERFTLIWRKITDALGTWWASPSGKILLNAAYFTPGGPETLPAPKPLTQPMEWDESSRVYRRDVRR
jgi:hypothetical protein